MNDELATEQQKAKLRYFGCTWDGAITYGQAEDSLRRCAVEFPELERRWSKTRQQPGWEPGRWQPIVFAVVVAGLITCGLYWVFALWHAEAPDTIGPALALIVAVIVYFIPTFVAEGRKHHNRTAIACLNLFLGWTFVGWVVALVWAYTNAPPKPK